MAQALLIRIRISAFRIRSEAVLIVDPAGSNLPNAQRYDLLLEESYWEAS